MYSTKRLIQAAIVVFTAVCIHGIAVSPRIKQIVEGMSLKCKIGQMTQLNINTILKKDNLNEIDLEKLQYYSELGIGSYLNTPYSGGLIDGQYGWNMTEWRHIVSTIQESAVNNGCGIPVIYGLDSVHGANYVRDAVMFPQQINAAAAFNPEIVWNIGRVTGKDTEAAGIPWIFSPIADIARHAAWPRVYETFGEDPYVAGLLVKNIVEGMQSNPQTAACLKHFIAYSGTFTGLDRDVVTVSDNDLLNHFARPYLAAIKEAKAKTVMESFNTINGEPVVSSKKILRDLLRHDMGFEGMMVTDWAEIKNLKDIHRTVPDYVRGTEKVMGETSVDMSMVPEDEQFYDDLFDLVEDGRVEISRLDESVQRILHLKEELKLFDKPVTGSDFDEVGTRDDVALALQAARESIVLLKNDNHTLPIPESPYTTSVFLTGPSSDSVRNLCGGWSASWQGIAENTRTTHASTIKESLWDILDEKSITNKEHMNVLDDSGHYNESDYSKAMELAAKAQYTIVVIGETPYAEKPGDAWDIEFPDSQLNFVRDLTKTASKVILVILAGRARLLKGLPAQVHAVVHGFLPCELGGKAIAEILMGHVNPSARLPVTYHKHNMLVGIQYYHRQGTVCQKNWVYEECDVEWEYGHGLSYTTFEYSNMEIDKDTVSVGACGNTNAEVTVSVDVTNTGSREGKEVVMLFLSKAYRESSSPETRLLKKMEKILLQPGETRRVEFTLSDADWSVFEAQIGHGFKSVTETGYYYAAFGYDTNCNMYTEEHDDIGSLCQKFKITT